MRKLRNIAIVSFACYAICSCISINGTGYSLLSQEERMRIKPCPIDMDSINDFGTLYSITAEETIAYIQQEEKVLVYEYLPFCKSKNCILPETVYDSCTTRGIKCLIISSTYDRLFPLNNKYPLFVINHSVYKKDNYQANSEKFYRAITKNDSDRRKYSNFHYFENGHYVDSY